MKALKKVGNFDGLQDVERWIDRFELAIEIDGLDGKEAQILSMSLEGAAYDAWKNMHEEDRKNAAKIKTVLRATFGLRRLDAWREALSTKVFIGDCIDVIAEKIRKLVVTSCEDKNPLNRVSGLILLEALPVNVQEKVRMHIGDDVSYENVLSASKKI